MERRATLTVVAIATAALIACGSTTSTSTETPRALDLVVDSEPPPDAAPSPDASPPAPPSVTVAQLADTMRSVGAEPVIAGLAELGLTVRCPTEGWEPGRAGVRESAKCPAGPVLLGDIEGTLDVWVSRRIEDGSAPGATISVTATRERDYGREEWKRRVSALLLEARNAVDEISAINEEPLPYFVELGGKVRAHIMDEKGEPLRLVVQRYSRPLLR